MEATCTSADEGPGQSEQSYELAQLGEQTTLDAGGALYQDIRHGRLTLMPACSASFQRMVNILVGAII